MKINIILEDFTAEFPHIIDKDRFEVVETKEVGTYIIRKKIPNSTGIPEIISEGSSN